MLSFFTLQHQLHNPEFEIFRGDKVPCFENPTRGDFVYEALTKAGHEITSEFSDSSEVLVKVHTKNYLNFLQTAWDQWLALNPENINRQVFPSVWPVSGLRADIEPENFGAKLGFYSMDNGTPMVSGTWEVVKAGADAAFTAANVLMDEKKDVFCALRPPGHHAHANFMGGYCFLNNAAVAAQTLRDRGCKSVAILDVDYHHGNGTQSIFYQRKDVLVLNIHADPSTDYPFFLGNADEIGEGSGEGFNINYPLPSGCSAKIWFDALASASEKIKQFDADALVVSLGLDTYIDDPISSFNLTSDDYIKLGEKIKGIGLPTIMILEGGYATEELGGNVTNVLQGFESEG